MSNHNREYIFGPVPSRRLGRSLGVDLVPFKTCSYDCVYCQLGGTTNKTTQRKQWAPVDIIISQLKEKLVSEPDYITLSGSGEPTLHSGIGQLISAVKKITNIPIAVLTNGSLLWRAEVRDAIKNADLVAPSLDAADDRVFQRINQPHPDIAFPDMVDGLLKFRREFTGKYWLEVFLLEGINTGDRQIEQLQACIQAIGPDKVQLNTAVRPTAAPVHPVSPDRLSSIARLLGSRAEVIADYQDIRRHQLFSVPAEAVIALLRRRPCSMEDIALGLGIHRNEALKLVEILLSTGKITAHSHDQQTFYQIAK